MWRQSWQVARFSLSFVVRLIVGIIFSAVVLRFFITSDIYGTKEPVANYRNVLSMAIDGDEFWTARAREQGLQTSLSKDRPGSTSHITDSNRKTCQDFFVTWPGDCIESHSYLDVRMRTLSAQIVVMNSTLTFFTSDLKGCTWDRYAGIRVALYNATEELITGGFSEQLPIIAKWDKTRFTRLSDILRLCLAHRHQMSYLDTDVHFLQLQRHWYERSYVGAQMWSDSKNAIEITNAAFCLPRDVLSDMMGFQKSVIMRKKEGTKHKYFYTELGPSTFHHVLFNRHSVTLYSQNNPAEPSLDRIARDIHSYGHKQLHLTGRIRKGNMALNFDQLVNIIRSKSGLPVLDIIPASEAPFEKYK